LAQGWEWHFLLCPAIDFASHAGPLRRGKSRKRGFFTKRHSRLALFRKALQDFSPEYVLADEAA
jgi:hypothetical protein